ncbi:Kinesin-like protein KIF24 [Smittium culicis]|uniref:Kinesin-like protein KIF24 n=1 Tax=Smittium culicis TaxID=133412 RepID=A0A1R1YSF6_9FUNG|nr:Kinesin-like protein KIF24 [Smittium culicis]
MSSDNFINILVSANLEHLLPGLNSIGIHGYDSLAKLHYNDYKKVGAVSSQDQEQLFELIQYLRKELQIFDTPEKAYSDQNDSFVKEDQYDENEFDSNSEPDLGSDYKSDDFSNDYNENMYETEWEAEGELPSDDDSDLQWNSLQLRINNGIDVDENKPQRIIREGTSTKNALLNAYGMPISKKTSPNQIINKIPVRNNTALSASTGGKITVCVRKRPMSNSEKSRAESDIIETGRGMLSVHEDKKKVDLTKYIEEHRFYFDHVFSENDNNQLVYQNVVSPLVDKIFDGGNATCFAYGQTGSGKTYTMLDSREGLYILAGQDIFQRILNPQYKGIQAVVVFYELYLTDVYDLLNDRKKLHVREKANHSVCIKDIAEVSVASVNDLYSVFEYGNKNRRIGSTGANSESSRSHAVMQIQLRRPKGSNPIGHTIGKLSFIDLAGNERGADRGDSQNDYNTRREGSEINKSLLALKECIRALDMGKSHQPFRQSRLTLVLRDSFIGNSLCCMIATVAPNSSNCDHTLNTLRYADRVKSIRGKSQPPSSVKNSPQKSSPRHSVGSKNALANKKLLSLPVSKPQLKSPRQVSANNSSVFPKKTQFISRKSLNPLAPDKTEKRRSTQLGSALSPIPNFKNRLDLNPNSSIRSIKSSTTFAPPLAPQLKKNSSVSALKAPIGPKFSSKLPNISEPPKFSKPVIKDPRNISPKSKTVEFKSFGGTSIEKKRIYSSEKTENFLKPNINRSLDSENSVAFKNKFTSTKSPNVQTNIRNTAKIAQGIIEITSPSVPNKKTSESGIRSNVSSSASSASNRIISEPKTISPNSSNSIKYSDWVLASKSKVDKITDRSSPSELSKLSISNIAQQNIELLERKLSPSQSSLADHYKSSKDDDMDIDFDQLNDFSNTKQNPKPNPISKKIEIVDRFILQHSQHIQFLKNACKEEILALSTYLSLAKKFSSFQSNVNSLGFSDSTSRTQFRPESDQEIAQTVYPLKEMFLDQKEADDLEIYKVSSLNDYKDSPISVSKNERQVSFNSVDEARMHFASEYLAQLDFILEAEIEEITGMRMELKNLTSNFMN